MFQTPKKLCYSISIESLFQNLLKILIIKVKYSNQQRNFYPHKNVASAYLKDFLFPK